MTIKEKIENAFKNAPKFGAQTSQESLEPRVAELEKVVPPLVETVQNLEEIVNQ